MAGGNYWITITGNRWVSSTFSHTGITLSGQEQRWVRAKRGQNFGLKLTSQGSLAHERRDVQILGRLLDEGRMHGHGFLLNIGDSDSDQLIFLVR